MASVGHPATHRSICRWATFIDFEAERARLGKEKSKVEADIDFVMKKLNNPKFVDKAPEKVVAAEREKAEKLREHLAKLEESIAALN